MTFEKFGSQALEDAGSRLSYAFYPPSVPRLGAPIVIVKLVAYAVIMNSLIR